MDTIHCDPEGSNSDTFKEAVKQITRDSIRRRLKYTPRFKRLP